VAVKTSSVCEEDISHFLQPRLQQKACPLDIELLRPWQAASTSQPWECTCPAAGIGGKVGMGFIGAMGGMVGMGAIGGIVGMGFHRAPSSFESAAGNASNSNQRSHTQVAVKTSSVCEEDISHFLQPRLQQKACPLDIELLRPWQAASTSQPWECTCPAAGIGGKVGMGFIGAMGGMVGMGAIGGIVGMGFHSAPVLSQVVPRPEHLLPGPQREPIPVQTELGPQTVSMPTQ